ncbi:MAG: hypothetical protein J0H83_16440 [Candidatus Melainabacteria bacterium]|nr:hypothetical protein [Candidatus Melainabacteria bacterium]
MSTEIESKQGVKADKSDQVVIDAYLIERIAVAMEAIVDKLSNLENKLDGLTAGLQNHGDLLVAALDQQLVEIEGCGDPQCDECEGDHD